MTTQRTYLRVREIADLVGVSERTIRRWLADGTLPSVKLSGTRLVARADLDRRLDGVPTANKNTPEIADG